MQDQWTLPLDQCPLWLFLFGYHFSDHDHDKHSNDDNHHNHSDDNNDNVGVPNIHKLHPIHYWQSMWGSAVYIPPL